ncbi:MAG: aspartyl protease family protein [Planctomycetales bacterium]|nr:aspartyl protease family protein [Planctomycetales bacterium]
MQHVIHAILLAALIWFNSPELSADDANVLAEFSVAKDGDYLVVPMTVNGAQHPFILDTATSTTTLDVALRSEVGESFGKSTGETSSGKIEFQLYRPRSMSLGLIPFPVESPVACIDLAQLREETGHQFYGILGMDFLRTRVLQIDFDAGRVRLLKSVSQQTTETMPLSFSVAGIPKTLLHLRGVGWKSFEVGTSGGGTSVRIEPKEFHSLSERGHIISQSTGSHLDAGGSTLVATGVLRSISMGAHSVEKLDVNTSRENVLGLPFLSRFNLTFDFPNRTVYFAPSSDLHRKARHNASGIHLIQSRDAIEVRVVTSEPARSAGIRAGDAVLSINGKPAQTLTLFKIRNLLSEAGREVRLKIRRREEVFDVSMTLTNLFPEPEFKPLPAKRTALRVIPDAD